MNQHKGNSLFKKTKTGKWSKMANIEGPFTTGYTHIRGYYEAATYLADIALSSESYDREKLIHPICFNYRHFIELSLKELIKNTQDLYSKSKELGYHVMDIEEEDLDVSNTHSLLRLLGYFGILLAGVSEEKISSKAVETINHFHQMDPNGVKFRYPFNQKGESNFLTLEEYDIENLKTEMASLKSHFDGVDGWVGYHQSIAADLLREYSSYQQG